MRAAIAILILVASPAAAAWQVTSHTDPLTDRTYNFASVRSVDPGAELVVQCLNGRVTPLVRFDLPVGIYKISMSYRFDAGRVVSHGVFLAKDGRSAWPWLAEEAAGLRSIRSSRRLRVQIFPPQSSPLFYDFDIIGAVEAVARVKC